MVRVLKGVGNADLGVVANVSGNDPMVRVLKVGKCGVRLGLVHGFKEQPDDEGTESAV